MKIHRLNDFKLCIIHSFIDADRQVLLRWRNVSTLREGGLIWVTINLTFINKLKYYPERIAFLCFFFY